MKKIINLAKTIWRNDTVMSYIVWMAISIIVSFGGAVASETCTDEVTKLFATVAWLFGMLSFGVQIAYLENHYNRLLSKTVECSNVKEQAMYKQMHGEIGKPAIFVLFEFPSNAHKDSVMKRLFINKKLDTPLAESFREGGLSTDDLKNTVVTVWDSEERK